MLIGTNALQLNKHVHPFYIHRFASPVPVYMRATHKDTEFEGYYLPKKTQVLSVDTCKDIINSILES